jgi:hypothetical protein
MGYLNSLQMIEMLNYNELLEHLFQKVGMKLSLA